MIEINDVIQQKKYVLSEKMTLEEVVQAYYKDVSPRIAAALYDGKFVGLNTIVKM